MSVRGVPRPGGDLGRATSSVSTPTAAAPTTVPPQQVKSLLLPISELESIVGQTGMTNVRVITEPALSIDGVTPEECATTGTVAVGTAYLGSRQSMAGDANRTPDGINASQVLATWENPETKPSSMLEQTRRAWEDCPEGEPFTVEGESGKPDTQWVRSAVVVEPTRISVDARQLSGAPRSCHHVFARKSNATVETLVCREGDATRQADEIADRILAKIPG